MTAPSRPRRPWRTPAALAAGLVVVAAMVVAWRSPTSPRRPPRHDVALVPTNVDVAASSGSTEPGVSVEGARAVALQVVASSGALVRCGPIGRSELLRRLFTAEALAQQVGDLDRAADVLATRLGVNPAWLVWVEQPLTARAESTAGGARVSVWSVVVFGTDAQRAGGRAALVPTVLWRTSVIDVVWRDGRWQATAMTATAGPTPTVDDAATVDGFARFRDVAGWPVVVAGVGL